jgi:diguanylate cyclase (GGDEF)-like protein
MLIIIGSAILNCAWLLPIYPVAGPAITAANGLLAAVAVVGHLLIRTIARQRPEVIVIGVLMAMDLVTAVLRIAHPSLFLITAGYLLLLPTAVALVVPWSITLHVVWLVGHVLAVVAMTAITPNPAAPPLGLAGLLVVSCALSLLGQVAGLRARVASFVQVQRIRALHRAADRDRARLDRLNRILERSALTDELTGLGNRMSLNLDLEALRSRVERRTERHAILLIDIDRFKAINDASGHLAGDEVLHRVAGALTSAIRRGDSAYRFGGEEFVVLARLRSPAEAPGIAERIRRAVAELAIAHPDNPPHGRVTVSVGVSAFGVDEADEPASLARADEALYAAKAAGRNTCRVAAVG